MSATPPVAIVALVPMRHHSARIPGKNMRRLGDWPLYHYIVRTLLACPSVARIVIDTDSPVIREDVERHFPGVQLLERPAHLRGDEVPMTEIIAHDDTVIGGAWYLQTHSTNPLLQAATIEQALQRWWSARHQYDSLFTVTRLQARLWNSQAQPLNHDLAALIPTQQLAPVFVENSCLYVFPAALIREQRRRIGQRPMLFELDPLEAVDIDEERDFAMAEQLLRAREPSTCATKS